MIWQGPSLKSDNAAKNQAALSITQILGYNSLRERERGREREREIETDRDRQTERERHLATLL